MDPEMDRPMISDRADLDKKANKGSGADSVCESVLGTIDTRRPGISSKLYILIFGDVSIWLIAKLGQACVDYGQECDDLIEHHPFARLAKRNLLLSMSRAGLKVAQRYVK
jgi:hypothetical protein